MNASENENISAIFSRENFLNILCSVICQNKWVDLKIMYIGEMRPPYIYNITKIMRMEPDFQRSREFIWSSREWKRRAIFH